ncbi:MAG: recombination mediator RecR [Chloroflexota bacterium]
MIYTSETIEKVVDSFSSLPSIGKKTAQRLTFYMLRQPEEFIARFAEALLELKKKVKYCSVCHNYTESDVCPICRSQKRDRSVICVVEEPNDVTAIEKTNDFSGLYHVLHGVINPLEGVSAEDLKVKELFTRLEGVKEIIFALNPSVEGEVTTQYLAKLIKPFGIKTTRIASGVPIGSSLEFSDEATLSRAIEGRTVV